MPWSGASARPARGIPTSQTWRPAAASTRRSGVGARGARGRGRAAHILVRLGDPPALRLCSRPELLIDESDLKLQVTGYGLQVTCSKLQVTGYMFQVAGYRLQVAGYMFQVAGYRLQAHGAGLGD